MRTRFLTTDYSDATATAAGGPIETLDFPHLPLPHLTPPNCTSFSANFLQSFHEIPVFGISREIDKLPIDDALSIFLSDVLPHFVCNAGFEELKIDTDKEKYQEKDGPISGFEGGDGPIFVQFEIPEIDIPLLPSKKSSVHSQIEHMDLFLEDPNPEYEKDLLNTEFVVHDLAAIQQLVYAVDDIRVDYLTQKNDLLEHVDSVQGTIYSHNIEFPEFEVDTESLGVIGRVHMMDELRSFEIIEKQQVIQPDEVFSDNKELLGPLEFDLIKYLLHHSVEIDCLEETQFSSQLDCISIIELSHYEQYTLGSTPDDFSIWSAEPNPFDEFMFCDMDPYNFCEVISDTANEIEYETCEYMFGEAMNFRSFNQLVVCHELTLLDDSFKSLPVPILSDHGNSSLLHTLITELLAQSDWQSASASDGLYLDWHFLVDGDCESAKCSSCWKMLWEIETYNIDIDMSSSGVAVVIFQFILSEDHSSNSSKPNAEKEKEVLDLNFSDVSIFHSLDRENLNSLKNHGDGERKNDIILKNGVEKVSMFGESMSIDLEFFLNPRNYVLGSENIPADTKSGSQGLMFSGGSAAVNSTSALQQKVNAKQRDMGSTSALEGCKSKLEDLLDTVTVKKNYEPMEAINDVEIFNTMPAQSIPVGSESKQDLSCMPIGPNKVIIVNTRNFNEEMVISRRTTYQRILEMEQEGSQVVERDIGLPLDVILSSAVSLTWYDSKNIGKKASTPDEACSSLPLCIESVAASILTTLSFAFSCCILIFEGESDFLGSIMESSDELYAAAASLGIDIQLFYSYSHEMTEEIIISCISIAAKWSTGQYPKMSDSESLAESFLNAFPSVNPLSAHAILSSNSELGKFLELSNGSRYCALRNYQVPHESIALLSVASKYGEREDSKSGMTDCSSSPSVPDSRNDQLKSAPERKKSKHIHKLTTDEPSNDLLPVDLGKLLSDFQYDFPNVSVSCDSGQSRRADLSRTVEFSLSFDDKSLFHGQEIDPDVMKSSGAGMMKSTDKSNLHNFPLARGLQISDKSEKTSVPPFDTDCSPRWRSATTLNNNSSRKSVKRTGIQQIDSTGEVIDVEDTPAFSEDFFLATSSNFSPTLLDVEKQYATKNPGMNKRPSSATNIPEFPNPTEFHAGSGAWVSKNGKRHILRDEIRPNCDIINGKSFSIMKQKEFMEEDTIEFVSQNSYKKYFPEKGSSDGTPLSNALHSTQPQGSPWTIEFLNRVREKSRMHKQSVSYDLPPTHLGSSGNTSKVTKRKSPSILEFYKYEGGSTPQRIVQERRNKRFSQAVNSMKTKKASASCPSSTPVDKRAGRILSFSTNGNVGQSKLVWRENDYQTSQRNP